MAAPYEKLEAESPQAFEAFTRYRDMGVDRTIAAVAKGLGKSAALCERWSQAHKWRIRCSAYDRDKDRQKLKAELKAIESMRFEQVQTALGLQSLGRRELNKLIKKSQAAGDKKATLNVDQVIRLVEVGSKIERINRGEPGEIVQHGAREVALGSLSTEQLRQLRDMKRKVMPEGSS